jgi:serine/threonine-protein kinase
MARPKPLVIGRFVLFDEFASGGAGTVHFGRMVGPGGFARTVAIKRLHPQFAKDPEFVSMFLDEARLAACIRDLHVVPTLDVVATAGELLLVMEYVNGVPLSHLVRALRADAASLPIGTAVGIMIDALLGLHAAHEAKSAQGEPLEVVHRDVSPQNILVGVDGVARVADFGIAMAVGRLHLTREGQVKGKPGYMAPEQIRGRSVDRRTDVYAASVVLWELLTGQRLFLADSAVGAMNQVFEKLPPNPSDVRPEVPKSLDRIVLRGLAQDPAERFASARELVDALEAVVEATPARRTGELVKRLAAKLLAERAERIVEIESSAHDLTRAPPEPPPEPSARPPSEDASRTRRRALLALPLAASLLGLGWLALHFTTRTRHGAALETDASPEDAALVLDTPSPPAAAPEAASALSLPPASATRGASRSRRPSSTKPPPPSCTPPYTIDADGTRHWKDGC